MTIDQMETVIREVAHSLAVENLVMTENEKNNLRKVARGEMSFSELEQFYLDQIQRSMTLDERTRASTL